MTHKQLTLEEREKFFALKLQDKSFRQIGKILGHHHTAFSREWRENTKYFKPYIPCIAQRRADRLKIKQRTKAPLKNVEVFLYVREKLRDQISPEMIAGRIKIDLPHQSIGVETIYRYIYGKGKEFKLWKYLPEKKKRRKVSKRKIRKAFKSSRIPNTRSIDERASKVLTRRQIGHFETDLMEGTRKEKTVLNVEIERKTRYVMLTKLQNKKAKTKSKVMQKRLKMIQSLSKVRRPLVKTITSDNGSENALHREIEINLNTRVYFAHAYHSWEKGSVENMIKRIRRYIPKGEKISKYTKQQIQWLENKMNTTPMKCLNYLTPIEMMEREANKYKFRSYQNNLFKGGAFRVRM